jgi:hypothetical protein
MAFITFATMTSFSACSYPGELSGSILFQFDLRYDNQHAAIMDYKLWASDYSMAQAPEEYVKQGRDFYFTSIQGPNKRLDNLYVKWRDIPSGKIYEKTINLRHLLPADINNDTIYLLIYGADLYVYLALHKPRPEGDKPVGAPLYKNQTNLQIYPPK